ncbi:hypothetical protein H0H81_000408 [Sphagnurus paluster]|uniref:polynucleotide adenylyltransferase n=1 Tax=Sphagnurus paluster TaxID=117069 RepID=A0A9P7K4I7_9AGAR|nr:hypothetical protein H0H81_000408 [Sphagnurus paluster]
MGANSSAENTPKNAESRRKRRRREKRESQGAEASGSTLPTPARTPPPNRSTANLTPGGISAQGTFEEGEDFIPFGFVDVEEDGKEVVQIVPREGDGPRRDKGKGKSREEQPVRELTRPGDEKEKERVDRRKEKDRDRGRDRERTRDREDNKDRDRDGDRDRRRDRSRNRDRTRDRDRGRDGTNNSKRKHEFDSNDGYANKKQRTDASSRLSPWTAGLKWQSCLHVAEMLHNEVEAFVNYISPSPAEDEVRGLIVSLITRVVTSSFPDATVHPFGSYQTKLYLPLGDIDLVILSQSMAYSNKVVVLQALAASLKNAGITDRVTVIAKAKVPIVKFITRHGRFNVDISINQENGIHSGNIINGFLQNMNGLNTDGKGCLALRSLVMITKAFLSQRSMNEVFSGGLGSYSIVCLAISFLQMHPKIRRGEIDPDKNLGVLVMDFFELYGCYFNYYEVGISLRDGGTYFNKRQRGWYDYGKGNLLSIEDPADPTNDISKGSFAFPKVKATFAGAFQILVSTANITAGILSSRRQGRSVRLSDEPEELSILCSVMGITQETINHRKLVQELYDKRILHNMLGIMPKPVVTNGHAPPATNNGNGRAGGSGKPSSSVTRANANSVNSAWRAADAEHEDSYKRHREIISVEDDDDDEEGRYHIGREPPHKRQKTGKQRDAHTVFTTDEDEDSLSNCVESEEEEEEAHYASDVDVGLSNSRPSNPEKADKRRSYWLSKGLGMEGSSSG